MLPEISTEISDQNFGNNSKIQIFFSEKRQNRQFREVDFARKGVRLVKTFLTGRTPFRPKSTSKLPILAIFRKTNLNFEIVAEILVRNFCRNFWQHDGNPSTSKSQATQFYAILWIIRKDMTF